MKRAIGRWLRKVADRLDPAVTAESSPALSQQKVLDPPAVREIPPGPTQIGYIGPLGPDRGGGALGHYPWGTGQGGYL